MRVTSLMMVVAARGRDTSLPVVDAERHARHPQPLNVLRRPAGLPPIEKKRDDAFAPQPLYAPVPHPPEPSRDERDEAREKPQRGVAIYDM